MKTQKLCKTTLVLAVLLVGSLVGMANGDHNELEDLLVKTDTNGAEIFDRPSGNSVSDNGQIGLDASYTAYLSYGEWYYVYYPNGIDEAFIIDWSFSGSSSFVGITVYAMDDYNYGRWADGYSATGYTLSDGSYYIHSGDWVPQYDDVWYIVYWNADPDQMYSTVSITQSADYAPATYYEHTYTKLDNDSDGYYDSVRFNFDPDLPTDNEGYVTIKAYLYNEYGTVVSYVEEDYYCIGQTRNTYNLIWDYEVTTHANFYFYAYLYPKGDSSHSDYTYTSLFDLYPMGYALPYIESFSTETYDSDDDGLDDGIKAIYDINYNVGMSGNTYVEINLYKGSSLVNSTSTTQFINSNNVDNFEFDFGRVTDAEYYHLEISIALGEFSPIIETIVDDAVELHPPGSGKPYIDNAYYETYSSGGSNDDCVKVFVDPDMLPGASATVQIYYALYDANDDLIADEIDSVYVNGEDSNNFEHDFGSVSETGWYYVFIGIYFDGDDTFIDSISSELFQLIVDGGSTSSEDGTDVDPARTEDDEEFDPSIIPILNAWQAFLVLTMIISVRKIKYLK